MSTLRSASKGMKITIGVLAGLFAAVVILIFVTTLMEKGSEDERVREVMESAAPPDMTDSEFAQFHDDLGKIHPDLVDNGIRAHARDTCTSFDSDRLIESTIARFSNADHDVTEDEAEQIVGLIRDIGFCDR